MSSPKDTLPKAQTAPSEAKSADQLYFPEDERSSMDWEGDHSQTDFDLDAEIEAKLGKEKKTAASLPEPVTITPARPAGPHGPSPAAERYFPEDERSSMDWEGDHSQTDFDLDAEIEAKLGKLEEQASTETTHTGVAPVSAGTLSPDSPLTEEHHTEQYFPEDERYAMDGEDDHSQVDFNLDAEIEAKLGTEKTPSPQKKKDGAAATPTAGEQGSPIPPPTNRGLSFANGDEHYCLDDERPSLDWEDDHSHGESEPDPENAPQSGSQNQVHPDLTASLNRSLAFAERGFTPQAAIRSGKESSQTAEGDSEPSADSGENSDEDSEGPKEPPFSAPQTENPLPAPAAEGSLVSDKEEDASKIDAQTAQREAYSAVQENAPSASPVAREEQSPGTSANDAHDEEEDRPMSLRDHFTELRKRLLRAFLWALVGFAACYPFAEELFSLLFQPLMRTMPEASRLIFTSPPEAFFTFLKVAFVAGIFLSSPLIFYQVWAFVAPGLYKEEKVYILPVAFFSAVFFISGGAFCYFVAFPFAFEFFMSYSKGIIQAMPALNETLSFVLQLLLAFGLVFELPLFVFFLARLGIITAQMMRKFRRYAILANVIIAAILTPPDVMSQMLMAGPLLLLYELSIVIAAVFGKKTPKKEEESEEEEEEEEPTSDAPEKLKESSAP